MGAPDLPYVYLRLSGPRSIRVMLLQPALRVADRICCSFLELTLDESNTRNDYEAISYTWGSPNTTKQILCDGRTVLVTPNCEQALRHLRRRFRPRRIWIDAVCINQQSVAEKNIQVPLMGDIYRRASRTIIWLGPDTKPELSGVLRRASRYGAYINKALGMLSGQPAELSYENCNIRDSRLHVPLLNKAETERIANLVSSAWFGRIWTVQEFLLSDRNVFRIGKVECSSLHFLRYFDIARGLISRPDVQNFTMRTELSEFRAVLSLDSDDFPSFMERLVRLITLNNCTDPRDKVYGIMSYLKDVCPDFPLGDIDYGKPVSEVYESFTRSMIQATKNLWPLEFIGSELRTRRHDTVDKGNIPSWVMDLRDPLLVTSPGRYPESPQNMEYTFLTEPYTQGKLRVHGEELGSVARVSSRMPYWDPMVGGGFSGNEMDVARLECLTQWKDFAANLDLDRDLVAVSPYRSLRPAAVFQRRGGDDDPCYDPHSRAIHRLTGDLRHLDHPRRSSDTSHSNLRDRFTPPWAMRDPVTFLWFRLKLRVELAYKKRVRRGLKRKRERLKEKFKFRSRCCNDGLILFLMTDGYLGRCEADVQVGDSIFSLQGAVPPFVLRQAKNPGEFIVVGKMVPPQLINWPRWDKLDRNNQGQGEEIVLV